MSLRLLLRGAIGLQLTFVSIGLVQVARAQAGANNCGTRPYTASLSVVRTADMNNVQARFMVSPSPCGMYGDVKLTSPSNRESGLANTSATQDFNATQIDINAALPMNFEDGIYVGLAHYKLEDETTSPWSYYPGPGSSNLATKTLSPSIAGFVQLYSTAWSPNQIHQDNSSSSFVVTARATNSCLGTTTVQATANSIPALSTWLFNGQSVATTVLGYLTPSAAGADATISFPFTFQHAAQTGTMNGVALFSQLPLNCDAKTGGSNTASLPIVP